MNVRVVDALWELRNLGVTCTEVSVDPQDDLDDVVAVLGQLEAQYQVAKVPGGRMDVMHALDASDFSFVEASIQVEHDLRFDEPGGVLQRVVENTQIVDLGPKGAASVASHIHEGMFNTDRVFLDPHFSPSQAARRYVGWLNDEIAAGATIHELRFRDHGVGFFLFREDSHRVGYSALSGLYEAGRTPGLGYALLYGVLVEARTRGLRRLSSSISASNLAVVKTHMSLGFSVVAVHYVYVRHVEE